VIDEPRQFGSQHLFSLEKCPLWIVGQPSPLLGHPVEIEEGMPAPNASAMPIAFGDFKAGYLINDRIGTRILRDP
jgi:HK97 family phage major capsid protein